MSLLSLGYLFLCLRGSIPDSISILVVNAAFPLGMVLQLDGMRRFLGGQELEREKIAESGTDAVVAKPIDPAALLATVQKIAARCNNNSLEK